MKGKFRILILGASYGSLLAAKLAMAGHSARLVCLPAEADLINAKGAIIKFPVRGRDGLVDIRTKDLDGEVTAAGPREVDPGDHDLVVLAMQEPQYRHSDIRDLLGRIGSSARPCMSIMNMPPLPYLRRIPGIDADACRDCYADATVWDGLSPQLMTLCSPDPQAFRPPDQPVNVLQVRLPTNFKVARFESEEHTEMLHQLELDILDTRWVVDGGLTEIPVKLRLHGSLFVPMAKWSMLLAGNYRCIGPDGMHSIRDAVHRDLDESHMIYEWVSEFCISIGANLSDMVPFYKYAAAAESLTTPSSAARALAAGAKDIERVDRLVQCIARSHGAHHEAIDGIVARVDAWLSDNRRR